MKILWGLLFVFIFGLNIYGQICAIPSLRGLKLGMTTQAVDAAFAVEDDFVEFDDVRYKISFTRNKLVRITAFYASAADQPMPQFAESYAQKLNLSGKWEFLEDYAKTRRLENEKAELLVKYTSEYIRIRQINEELKALKTSKPILKCANFNLILEIDNKGRPVATFKLTNNYKSNGEFTP